MSQSQINPLCADLGKANRLKWLNVNFFVYFSDHFGEFEKIIKFQPIEPFEKFKKLN